MADQWLVDYDACALLGQEIMAAITDRNKQPRTSTAYTKKSATIRSNMTKFSRDLTQLREDLTRSSLHHRLTQRESDRRQAAIDQLFTKQKQLELAFKNEDQNTIQRSALMTSSNPFAEDVWSGARGGGYDNDNMTVDEIRQQQHQMIREQDRGLDALSHVISRQKQIAIHIGNEVVQQNEIIDDITDHTDQTRTRLIRETQHVEFINKKSGACWMWVVIVLLFIAIIVVSTVPFHS